jgi:hypothetical protein
MCECEKTNGNFKWSVFVRVDTFNNKFGEKETYPVFTVPEMLCYKCFRERMLNYRREIILKGV